jgi:hypothetical protein
MDSLGFLTVGAYIRDVRTLLLDKLVPYRYDTGSLVRALNETLYDVRRLRPDLLTDYLDNVPQYEWVSALDGTANAAGDQNSDDDDNPTWNQWVPIEQQFRQALIHGIVGHALKRNQDDIEDERATGFIMTFENMLVSVKTTTGKAPPKV